MDSGNMGGPDHTGHTDHDITDHTGHTDLRAETEQQALNQALCQPFWENHRLAAFYNFGCFWLAGSQTHAGAHRHGPADLGRGDELHQGLYADHQGAKPSQEPTTGPQPARLRVQLPLPQPRRAARQAQPAARRGGRKR